MNTVKQVNKFCALCFLFALIPGLAFSQCKAWKWPGDSVRAKEMVAVFQDAVKAKQYAQATRPFQWLILHAPDLNVSIYIKGAEVYDELARREKDGQRRKALVDSLLFIYDLRSRYCGDAVNVTNRKALAYFKYYVNGPNPEKVLSLLDNTFKENGNEVLDEMLLPYMEAIVVTQQRKKSLHQDDIMNRYETMLDIFNHKLETSASDKAREAKLKNYKLQIDELLLKVVDINCNFVHARLEPEYREHPDSVLAKRIFYYLLKGNCTNDSLWLETGEVIFRKEKDFGLAKNLAIAFLTMENTSKAGQYFNEALELAPDGPDSAAMYMYLGELATRKSDKVGAREMYRRAIRADRRNPEAYVQIGNLYFNSFHECARLISMADDRLVYLLAYDYYEKGGNADKMKMAMKYFPSREEIFIMNYQAGNKIKVGCWIDETTIIRTRD